MTTPPAEVTATEFRNNIARIFRDAHYGHPITITNNGEPFVKLVHPDADEGELTCLRNRVAALEANGNELLARAEQAEAALSEIKRVTDSPADEEMPTDPAELREMWEFINRQSRWQHHMAQKFFRGRHRALRRAKAAEAEQDALKAAVEALAERWENALAVDRPYARDLRAVIDIPAPTTRTETP